MSTLAASLRITDPMIAGVGQTVFLAGFRVVDPTAIRFQYETGGVIHTLDPSGFAMSLLTDDGFTLTLDAPMAGGEACWIYSTCQVQRAQEYLPGGAVRSQTLEEDFDDALCFVQEARRDLGRAILSPYGEFGLVLPLAAGRGGSVWVWSNDGLSEDTSHLATTSLVNVAPLDNGLFGWDGAGNQIAYTLDFVRFGVQAVADTLFGWDHAGAPTHYPVSGFQVAVGAVANSVYGWDNLGHPVSIPIASLGGGGGGGGTTYFAGAGLTLAGATFSIANGGLIFAMLPNIGAATLLGNLTGAPTAPSANTLAAVAAALTGVASALKWQTGRSVTFATGDVTGTFTIDGSANVANVGLIIGANAVTVAKMQQIATGSFLCRATAGTGNVEIKSIAQVQAMLGLNGSLAGEVLGPFSLASASGGSCGASIASIRVQPFLQCTVATWGFNVGDKIYLSNDAAPAGSGGSEGVGTYLRGADLRYVVGANGVQVLRPDTAAEAHATDSNFQLYFRNWGY